MLIGILSDAHGNPFGFSNCVRRLQEEGAERLYYLGDCVGYLPDPGPILDQLKQLNAVCLKGNHEEMLLGALPLSAERDRVYRLRNVRETIGDDRLAFISQWHGPSICLDLAGRQVAFFHGSPWSPVDGYVYPDSDLSRFAELPYDCVFMGHTHRPFVAQVGHVQVVNVGSCGLPRDIGNVASCAIYDTDTSLVRILRMPFDVEQVIETYGDALHGAVIDCLRRTDIGRPVQTAWVGNDQ